jgi:hypothetical protein
MRTAAGTLYQRIPGGSAMMATVQNKGFPLAGLLANVNPQNLIKPNVANGCLLSIVMVNGLAKLSLNLTKPDIHARGMTTNDDILNQEIITSKKLIVGNKFPCWLVV